MMDKTFDPKAVEGRIAAAWQEAGAFRAGRPERTGAGPFTVVIPPPNVTGSLHMGHALNTTLQDILCRFERMRGKDVLWQPGTDHAGIATQMVVERQLMENQEPGRHALGREKFLERVWQWKAQSGGAIVEQLKRLGASCDWSRERFTLDEGLSRAVTKVFVELYNQGLIYKDKRLVNWDPELQTAISDLEVKQVETKGHLWHFKYPVVDDAGKETGEFVVVATTRPETMLGDTAVAVHPSDERYKHLHGKNVRLPLVGRLIPIIADEYSDPEKGTGAVKITPAHDFNDFEVGKRHGLPPSIIMDEGARIKTEYVFAEYEAFKFKPEPGTVSSRPLHIFVREPDDRLKDLNNRDRFVVRAAIVKLMEADGWVDKIEPHTHMVPHGDRSGADIEPRLTEQWYVDAKTLAQPALDAVQSGKTHFVPQNWEKTYFQWLENIQPWCISRQLWWGHRIPAWYGPDKHLFVEASEIESKSAAEAHYNCEARVSYPKSTSVVDEVTSRVAELSALKDGSAKQITITQDEDVLDTWFSSALWPFSTLGWPDETLELRNRYPTNVLITGFDIIFFWVARMMMMGLHFMGDVPFRDVYIHALVRDAAGAKMSKSKGNVVDPLELIDTYGADALRFTLAAMAAQGRDIKLSLPRIEGYRNFGTKLWNAARFAEMNGCVFRPSFDPRQTKLALNRWIIGETAKAIAEVTASIEAYRFNDAANALYKFVWNVFCDWYLELAKPLLQGSDGSDKEETRATTAFVREEIIKLLHPFMPFMTEELWAITASADLPRESLLALAQWPTSESLDVLHGRTEDLEGASFDDAFDALVRPENEIGFVIDIVSEIRSVRAELNVPPGAQIVAVLVNAAAEIKSFAEAWGETIKRLARLKEISFAQKPPERSVQLLVRGTVCALSLHGIIDLQAENARLAKEIAKLGGEAAKLEGKLNNADFIARAPEEIIEENRERLGETLMRRDKLAAALARLGAT